MPTFNGVNIFGTAVQMVTEALTFETQENDYPGLYGVESLGLGQRGNQTECTGLLIATSRSDLDTLESNFRSFNDGNTYVLFDSFGTTWNNVMLKRFKPEGRVKQDVSAGVWFRPYTATFRHLTNT